MTRTYVAEKRAKIQRINHHKCIKSTTEQITNLLTHEEKEEVKIWTINEGTKEQAR